MEIAGYEVERCLAQGSMASAYLATQTSLGRPVVLKVLDTSIVDTPQALQRFLNEGRLIASLHHPHLITVHDIGTAGRFVYISMEYVEGGDLKQRLTEGPLPPDLALEVLEKTASALAYAHAHGVIHRDVKPGNILFRRDGSPVLTDFGIAKSLAADGDLTGTGVFLGSPNYMAPEQVESGAVDNGADIYALGVILYEMLTGQKPFISSSIIDVIYMHKKTPMPRLPAPFEPLQGMLDLMVAKSRSDRFRDITALLHYLDMLRRRGALACLAAGAEVVTPPPVPVAPRRRRGMQVALLGGLTLVGLAYASLFVIEHRLAAPPSDSPALSQSSALPAEPPPEEGGVAAAAEVTQALIWLGQHSVNEFRLTAPPRDNAYYYFTRLRQLAPDHPAVAAGFKDMAGAYAVLAERAIATGNTQQARALIALARQMDPTNAALPMLSELAKTAPVGVWQQLTGWLR